MIGRIRRALPIRWKLAITCAALTFAILALFATVIGLFAGRQVRAGFDDDLRTAAVDLQDRVKIGPTGRTRSALGGLDEDLMLAAAAGDARIRVVHLDGGVMFPEGAPDLGPARRVHRQRRPVPRRLAAADRPDGSAAARSPTCSTPSRARTPSTRSRRSGCS